MTPPDDIFNQGDDSRPVTRGEMRRLHQQFRSDMKWTAAMILVGTQTLSHIELPEVAGFVGAGIMAVLYAAKVLFARS
jgi:hypothetical protein